MSAIQPWVLKPSLAEDRLNLLGRQFREVFYGVESLLCTDDDCNYGRGALFFGRARQRLINLALDGNYPWLKLTNPGMDITLEVDGIPFRFFRDDHENPKKKGFWRRNDCDQLFALEEVVCEWRYGRVNVLHGIDKIQPPAVEQHAAPVGLVDEDADRATQTK